MFMSKKANVMRNPAATWLGVPLKRKMKCQDHRDTDGAWICSLTYLEEEDERAGHEQLVQHHRQL
eukprot:1761982-Rhodomonas_salina.3